MTNEQMKPNRFGRWYEARKKLNAIVKALNSGHTVMLSTYAKHTQYTKKHIGMFKATKSGLYVQQGKNWVCVDGCKITAWI